VLAHILPQRRRNMNLAHRLIIKDAMKAERIHDYVCALSPAFIRR
jgi:hypothetical protein